MSAKPSPAEEGRKRVIIEAVSPQVEAGRYPIKRILGESVEVEADAYADGHDAVACAVLYRFEGERVWQATPMRALGNDRYGGSFHVSRLGRYRYTVCAWVDDYGTWRRDLDKRRRAGQDLALPFAVGAELLESAAARAAAAGATGDAERLARLAAELTSPAADEQKFALAEEPAIAELAGRHHDEDRVSRHGQELQVIVDRERAGCGAWYEMFPRSTWHPEAAGRHATLRDCIARLPYIAEMGFDVLYLPPIHAIGASRRKGRNNAVEAAADDVGSPWAIGDAEGGHKDIHPELGTMADFRELLSQARAHNMELALDIAFQCSPDHPYVRQHPEWFRRLPDGSIQYAENPPKKYQDIYPFDFECADWQALWQELLSVLLFWADGGVGIFRVDNPHTKSFRFWQWAIARVKERHPQQIFLSEAFTRPKVMHHLARIGFTQSYTYFTWRNSKWEIEQYFSELTAGPAREYFRPNLWPNTPDILPEYLQFGGRPAFIIRLVLAATLGANYGIYGPAFELCLHEPREPGSEEYLHSEKYELKHWHVGRDDSLKAVIARVNRIRRENPAFANDKSLRFHHIDSEHLIAYSKVATDAANAVLVVVNVNPYQKHGGWLTVSLEDFEIVPGQPYQMHDLLSGARYAWHGERNFIELDPGIAPAHIFRLRRHVRSERDFDYFL